MKHRVYGKHLGRNKDERDTLFKSVVQSLFLHGTIITSEAKAKAIKGLVDKIINLAKNKKRNYLLQSYLLNQDLQNRLIKEIAPKFASRTSGYTSLIRLGQRSGDNTMMVRMSLIGAEELKPLEKGIVKKTAEIKRPVTKKKIEPKKPVRKTKLTKTKNGNK